jgi:hypothetical protein
VGRFTERGWTSTFLLQPEKRGSRNLLSIKKLIQRGRERERERERESICFWVLLATQLLIISRTHNNNNK